MNAKNVNVKMANSGLEGVNLSPTVLENTAPSVLRERTMREHSEDPKMFIGKMRIDYGSFTEDVQSALRAYDDLLLTEQSAARDGFIVALHVLGAITATKDCRWFMRKHDLVSLSYLLNREDKRDQDRFIAFVTGFTDATKMLNLSFPQGPASVQAALNFTKSKTRAELRQFVAMPRSMYTIAEKVRVLAKMQCGMKLDDADMATFCISSRRLVEDRASVDDEGEPTRRMMLNLDSIDDEGNLQSK